MQYRFFYDETEHSRKINLQTVTADNYYDNFIAGIVGWKNANDKSISQKYIAFESRYDFRKKNGELKSQTMKSKDLRMGFASLTVKKIGFYEDFIALFDEDVIINFSVCSKIEYVIDQILANYHNTIVLNIDNMKYSIIKAINIYHPRKLIESIYKDADIFVRELKAFLKEQINKNQVNADLKERENMAFEQILLLLDEVEVPKTLDWSYFAPFDGFTKLLMEMSINDYELLIDREGEDSRTLRSALQVGIANVKEEDSKCSIGIRMADMIIGLISKLMQALSNELRGDYGNGKIEKTLLDSGWFALNQKQLDLYKKLYKVICVDNKHWYNTYSGNYSDDLVSFISLLQYMDQFEKAENIREGKLEMQPEFFNAFVCHNLQERYEQRCNKLPIEYIPLDNKEYYLNQKGAAVFKDIQLQPELRLHKGKNRFTVLSVGFSNNEVPLVTICIFRSGKTYCTEFQNTPSGV